MPSMTSFLFTDRMDIVETEKDERERKRGSKKGERKRERKRKRNTLGKVKVTVRWQMV